MLNSKGEICDAFKRALKQGDLVGYGTANMSTSFLEPAIYLGENFTKKGGVHKSLPFKLLVDEPSLLSENLSPPSQGMIREKNISSTRSIVKLNAELTPEIKKIMEFYKEEKA